MHLQNLWGGKLPRLRNVGEVKIHPLLTAMIVGLLFTIPTSSPSSGAVVTRYIGVTLNAFNGEDYNLDVDGDGTTDFTIQTAYVPDPTLTVGFDQFVFPFGGSNGVVIDTQTNDGFPPVSLLTPGNTISSASLFCLSGDDADLYFDDTIDPITGNFGGNSGDVGFRFTNASGIHYGYVQISVDSLNDPNTPFNLTIGNVSYDNVAGEAIQIPSVPEPASMATLGFVGVGGLMSLRRPRRATAVS